MRSSPDDPAHTCSDTPNRVSGTLRILNVAREQLLPVLSSIDQHTARELNKSDARQLADEVTRLRERAELPGLDEDLTALAEVARWCARASGEAWLTIEGR
jgi:hypothetical protein